MNFREGNVMLNCVISAMTASKLMRKGCMVYLAYVIDFRKGEVRIKNLLIVKEFPDVFWRNYQGYPRKKK